MNETTSVFDFPCQFPIKAMGRNTSNFECSVIAIVRKHCAYLGEGAVITKHSRNNKFLSITVTIEATGQAQLDGIYQDLHDSPLVTMTL